MEGFVLKPKLLTHMLQNTLHHKITIGLLGNIITERYGDSAGMFDVKYGAYIPLVNGIRLLALAFGLSETSTLTRLQKLGDLKAFPVVELGQLRLAFEFALELRSSTEHEYENGLYNSPGMVDPDRMTKSDKRRLKQTLKTGMELQQAVRRAVERLAEESLKKRGGTP